MYRKRPHKHHCDLCGKTFRDKHDLGKHETTHTGQKPHECDYCGQSFGRKDKLRSHIKKKHQIQWNTNKKYYAKKPHSHFSLSLLKVSLKRQRQSPFCGRIPHPCDLCGKVFRDARDLQRHNMVHTGEKPYSCSYCSTKFRQKAHLKRHLKDKHDRAEPTEAELRPNYDWDMKINFAI